MKMEFTGQRARVVAVEVRMGNEHMFYPSGHRERVYNVSFAFDGSADEYLVRMHCGLALIASTLVDSKVYPRKTTETDLIRMIGEALHSLDYPADELRSFKS